MSRRIFYVALFALLVAVSLPVDAQLHKVPRLGVLSGGSARPEAFHNELRKLGYIEGQNILVEYRYAEGSYDRLPDLAAELVRLQVDIIFACCPGGLPSAAAKNVTTTIPIVFVRMGDPVGPGAVASLARPGGNVTGLSGFSRELSGKQLELLKEVVPIIFRVAVLLDPAINTPFLEEFEAVAPALGVKLKVLGVRTPGDLNKIFPALTKERADALAVSDNTIFFTHRKQIVEFATKSRLPTVFALKEYVEAGGLMSYGVNVADLFRRAATYVDRILKGAKPADLPVEQPTKFELIINLKTAKQIGLTIPPNVLARADRVIR
jgi:putative ABC transport system substrate-binding protein